MPKIFNIDNVAFEEKKISIPEFAWKISEKLSEKVDSKKMHFNFVSLDKGKFSYPYHFHRNTEELFVIISGSAILRTPNGFQEVKQGDVIFIEMGYSGAHQFYNNKKDPLVYLDIRIKSDVDIVDYPDSNKVNILPFMDIFKLKDKVDYFEDETDVKKHWPEEILKES